MRRQRALTLSRLSLAAAALAAIGATQAIAAPNTAAQDRLEAVANAICAARDVAKVDDVLGTLGPTAFLTDEDIAEAFGYAMFLADLGRCANKQAIADGYANFKRSHQSDQALDEGLARGHIQGAVPNGGSASVAFYQGSYGSLGTAGDPPSGK